MKEPTKEQWKGYNDWRHCAKSINLTVYQWIEKYDTPK